MAFIQMMRQWERRVAVVDDRTPLPHMAATTPASMPVVAAAGAGAESGAAAPMVPDPGPAS